MRAALDILPVVVVMGARQTGKSTLVRALGEHDRRHYLSLDDLDIRAQARDAPWDLVRRAPRLTLDEIQREPDLLLAVKEAVDKDRPRRPGRFLLTGSANLLLMHRVSETLAGRASYIPLRPFTRGERLGQARAGRWSELLGTAPSEWPALLAETESAEGDTQEALRDWRALAREGGYPTPAYELTDPDARRTWFQAYVQTYLERDLQDLSAIENLVDFQRLMRAAALRTGGLLNQAELARDVGLPRPTAHRYLALLEASFQLVRLEPYAVNRTKRLVRSPRLYWVDTGLCLHLSGQPEPEGAHLENLLLSDLLAWRDASRPEAQVLFWRTHSGEEVDFVIEDGDRLLAVEVKAARRVGASAARHLRTFREQYGERVHGCLVLYDGEETFRLSEGIVAAPWHRVT